MTYQTEFPDFPAEAMPAIPEGFVDRSWHNDACPCLIHEASGMIIWVGQPAPEEREWDGARIIVERCIDYHPEAGWQVGTGSITLMEHDDWPTVERSLPGFLKPVLAERYKELIGYDPFEDDPTIAVTEVAQTLIEWGAEAGKIAQAAIGEEVELSADDALWLASQHFEAEVGGGGAMFLSRYLPSGAYVWLTGGEGGFGMPRADSFCACAYPAGWDGEDPLCDFRNDDDSPLGFRDAVARALALAKGEAA